ncbi:MAG: sodium:calcium antiporter [Candidatus Bathyarchaeia archaeon]
MFEELGLIGNAIILLAALIALVKASDVAVTNAVSIAGATGFGKTTIGFLLVAFSTTLPELFVSVFSAFDPETIGVALGNALGSNVTNIGLILGVCFLLIALKKSSFSPLTSGSTKEEIRRLHFGLFVASIVPLALLYIGYASQFIGIILLGIFIFNAYMLSKIKTNQNNNGATEVSKNKLKKWMLLFAVGAAGVVITAYLIVNSASAIAEGLGVPSVVIGATIVAFGTSVPELANSITSTIKGHLDLALGNIVGSCFINITLILGVALVASPLRVQIAGFSNVTVFSLITTLFLWYFLSSERITWREGAMLLMLYAVFLATTFSS